MDGLDLGLLLQQIDHGVFNLVELIDWLGAILKSPCAPISDVLVDSMCNTITYGAYQAECTLIGDGLRQLFALLEAMKLNIANHQIKLIRLPRIAHTIDFQRRYNAHCIRLGKIL